MQDRSMGSRQEFRERCLLLEETYYPELANDEDARVWDYMNWNAISNWLGHRKARQMVQ